VCADSRVGIEKRERGKGKNKKKKKRKEGANRGLRTRNFPYRRNFNVRVPRFRVTLADSSTGAIVTGRVMSPGVTLYTKGERAFWTGTLGYSSSIKTEKSKIRGNRNAIACAHSASRAAEWGGGARDG